MTADTIKIGYYIAKPDPVGDALLKAAGAYDTPDNNAKAAQDYAAIYGGMFQTVGPQDAARAHQRHRFVERRDRRRGNDADADRPRTTVFAVVGGPSQARQFGDELAAKHILCVGTCIISQPQKYIEQNSPYMWPAEPVARADLDDDRRRSSRTSSSGKPAQYGGSDVNGKPRTFTLLTYDTPDGQYKASWDDLEAKVKAAGAKVVVARRLLPEPADAADRRPHDRDEAEAGGRDVDHLHR